MPNRFGDDPITQEQPKVNRFGDAPISEPLKANNEFSSFREEQIEQGKRPFAEKFIEKGVKEPAQGLASMIGHLLKTGGGAALELGATPIKGIVSPQQTGKDLTQTVIEGASRAVGDIGETGRSFIKNPLKLSNPLLNAAIESMRPTTEEGIEEAYKESKYQQMAEENRGRSSPVKIPGAKTMENTAEGISLLTDPEAIGASLAGKAGLKSLSKSMVSTPEKTLTKAGEKYREVLAPKKSNIKNVEIKAGKDLKDSYELAAKEGLIIEKSADNKLDTLGAIEQLEKPTKQLNDELSDALASNPDQKFDLLELEKDVKPKLRKIFDNDADFKDALETVKREVAASIEERGQMVDGVEFNKIKRGMWSKGYNAMAPNTNKIARAVGNVIKEKIEKAYPDQNIKALNSKLGEYATLRNLLQDAHGNVVARGKLGRYFAQGIGALAGSSIPFIGELGGGYLGGKVSDYFVDPKRITKKTAKQVSKIPAADMLKLQKAVESSTPPPLPPSP